MPETGVKDKNYNLITAIQVSLHYAWELETFIKDAEEAGDDDLANWFRRIQENDRKAGEQGLKMLQDRL
jgi:hypothetical protein